MAPKLVFAIADALPNRYVGPEHMPTLWAEIAEGGWHPAGGISSMTSSTYPNHATFATGTEPVDHRLFTNDVWHDNTWQAAADVGPATPTFFDAARAAGLSTSIVAGDAKIVGSMGGFAADTFWPPKGYTPEPDTPTDEFGYVTDGVVLEMIDTHRILDAELAVVHFNEPDTTMHIHGPDSPETIAQVAKTDESFRQLFDRLRPRWNDTVVCVVSDHEHELVVDGNEVDLKAELAARGLPGKVRYEHTAAAIVDGPAVADLLAIDNIEGAVQVDDHLVLAWPVPTYTIGPSMGMKGVHGGPRTRTQVAAVVGGHPDVHRVARALADRQPTGADWAPTLAALGGFAMPTATGQPLLA